MSTRTSQDLLRIEDLTVEYRTLEGNAKAIQSVTLDLKKGETLALVGESGSGKSTLGLAVMGLLPPAAKKPTGKIFFGEMEVTSLDEGRLRPLRGSKIAMIFQDPMTSLNPVKKIGDHFTEYIRAHNPRTSKEEALKLTESILKELGIRTERLSDYPHQFSGGMRQRVMIGLALVLNPELIIADEPTTALDVIVEAQIIEQLRELREKFSLSILLITHNMGIVAQMADRVAVMYAGKIAEVAPVTEIFLNPSHPYTQALLKSIPTVEGGRRVLNVIPGFPPDLRNLPSGCAFHPRCPFAFERCKVEEPKLQHVSAEGLAACHLLDRK
ncbi:MAG TPA: ABC transporter ATP-binding protein [Nitrososphaerales archaeon]|nr:ABC transporter ATP-binding protein [Nitrososphaerales archaeon]